MAAFDYLAIDVDGRERQGLLEAADESDARSRLARKQWVPVRLAPAAATPRSRGSR